MYFADKRVKRQTNNKKRKFEKWGISLIGKARAPN